jgi:hypothetical protein
LTEEDLERIYAVIAGSGESLGEGAQ